MDIPLILDTFVFQDFEIPEQFKQIGGKQAHSLREFPGGLRTIYNLGFFPLPLDWSGYFSGPNAFSRAAQLQRICVAGNLVLLSYGPWQWRGELVRFVAEPRHQFLIPYKANFEPTEDLSGIGTSPTPMPSPESQVATQMSSLNAQSNGSATTLTGTGAP